MVYLCLYGCYHLGGDDIACANLSLRIVGSEIAAHDKEFALHIGEEGNVSLVGTVCNEQAELGVEFIYCAIALETVAALAHSLTTYEGGLSAVACFGVYLHVIMICMF